MTARVNQSVRGRDPQLPWFVAVLVTTFAGGLLRFHGLAAPSLWLDEILNAEILARVVHGSPLVWLTGIDGENGPLYYLTLFLGRIWASPELSMRIVAAAIGTACIPLAAVAGRRLWTPMAGVAAAILVATSPMHVYYSREGRAYALLMLASTLIVIGLSAVRAVAVRWVVAGCIVATLSAASSFPLIVTAAVVGATGWFASRSSSPDRAERRRWRAIFVTAVTCLILMAALYGHFPRGAPPLGAPPITAGLFLRILQGFSVAVEDVHFFRNAAWFFLLAFVAGVYAVSRRAGVLAVMLVIGVVVPIVLAVASLNVMKHWFSIRYVAVSLPTYLIVAGAGVASICEWVASLLSRTEKSRKMLGVALGLAGAVSLAACAIPSTLSEPYRKADWRLVASTIWAHARPGDTVIATNDWTFICLRFYLAMLPPKVTVFNAAESPEGARYTIEKHGGEAWIVSGGFHRNERIRGWMCDSFPVYAQSAESLRLYFYPDFQSWITTRTTTGERGQFVDAFRDREGVISLGEPGSEFIGRGFSAPERTAGGHSFRWLASDRGSILVPIGDRSPRWLHWRSSPADSGQPGTFTVVANGKAVATVQQKAENSNYSVGLFPPTLKPGVNVIEFQCSRTVIPAERGNSSDRRTLCASFDEIEVTAEPNPQKSDSSRGSFASLAPTLLDADGAPQTPAGVPLDFFQKPLIDPSKWRRENLEALLERMGLGPAFYSPLILRGKLPIERSLNTMIERWSCAGDEDFIQHAFLVTLARPADPSGLSYYMNRLRLGRTRESVVRSLVNSPEFRRENLR